MKNTFISIALTTAGVLLLSTSVFAETHIREIDREFSATDIDKLEIRISSGMITAVAGDAPVIRIEVDLESKAGDAAKAEELFDNTDVLFEESGGRLSLIVRPHKQKGFFSIFRRIRNQVTAEVTVTVPRDMDVRLDTGSGSIVAEGLVGNIVLDTGSGLVRGTNLAGEVFVDTGSGNVILENVNGNIRADTGSGNIDVTGINGELVADTGSGSVNATGEIHRFSADTGSGSIKIQSFTTPKDRSVADTGSGSIRIQLPGSARFSLDADVGSGRIDCSFPVQLVEQKKDSLKADANGGGPLLRLDTGSGNISVHPNS